MNSKVVAAPVKAGQVLQVHRSATTSKVRRHNCARMFDAADSNRKSDEGRTVFTILTSES
jgi:hypothetical protein